MGNDLGNVARRVAGEEVVPHGRGERAVRGDLVVLVDLCLF